MKKITMGIFALLVLGIIATAGIATAFGPDNGQNVDEREAMRDAVEAGDYDAWLEAVNSLERTPRIAETINEDNFDTMVEMHEAMEEGDFDKASELREELGLDQGRGMHRGLNKGVVCGQFRGYTNFR